MFSQIPDSPRSRNATTTGRRRRLFHQPWIATLVLGAALGVSQIEAKPVNLIVDTDLGTDCDDAGAFAVMHALADRGEVNLLAVGVVNGHPDAVRAVDAINTWYGRPTLPVGVIKHGAPFSIDDYVGGIAREFPHDLTKDKAPEVVALYRQILASQPDRSVTLVALGPATNISRLLDSRGDQHSPLSGVELVRRKIALYSAGGNGSKGLPYGLAGYNYRSDPVAAANELAKLPDDFPTVFAGGTGWDIKIGSAYKKKPSDHIVRRAYEHYLGPKSNLDRASVDALRVLYAARPHSRHRWDHVSKRGSVIVKGEHIIHSSKPDQNRSYAYIHKPANRTAVEREMEELMLHNPHPTKPSPPPSVSPTISRQPSSRSVSEGAAVSFSVEASGLPAPSFQWYKGGSLIKGATSSSFTLGAATPADAGAYAVVVKNSAGSVTSQSASLTVLPHVGDGGAGKLTGTVIGTSPYGGSASYVGAKVFDGNASSFFAGDPKQKTVLVGLDLGKPKRVNKIRFLPRKGYASRMKGGRFRGANRADLSDAVTLHTIPATPSQTWQEVAVGDAGAFRYVFYTTSSIHEATVAELEFFSSDGGAGDGHQGDGSEPATPPQIVSQPQDMTVPEGDPVTFRVTTSAAKVSHQWRRDGVNIPGATSDSFHIQVALGEDAGDYSVVVTANGVSVTSRGAALTVRPVVTEAGELTGKVINSRPYQGRSSFDGVKAFDGSAASDFAGDPGEKHVYVGLDLGAAKPVTKIRFLPRAGYAWRMAGGQFRGANRADRSDAVTLHTIKATPAQTWHEVSVKNAAAFRYVFYTTASHHEANVAELEFHGGSTVPRHPAPTTLNGTAISSTPYGGDARYAGGKAFDENPGSFFAGRPQDRFVYVGLDLGAARAVGKIRFKPRPGFGYRMNGGKFRGANRADLSDAITLHTIKSTPSSGWHEAEVNNTSGFRYVFYTTTSANEANVAEIELISR